MDANIESQANDMFVPDISGEAANESMPQDNNANPTPSNEDRLSNLEAENRNLRKGVNPLIDENKALKAELEQYKANQQAQVQEEVPQNDTNLTDEYERLDIATNTRLRQEIENVKQEIKDEEEIKSLNLGEHSKVLKNLMKLPENAGKRPHMVAEENSLGDLAKIEEAKSRGIIGRSPDTKKYSNVDEIDFNNNDEYNQLIKSNSNSGGGINFTVEG